ncbi:MAG: transcriptional repressor [Gemmatimonadaceae bacterium]|nr:transcriptional repressor [Gemmatimonadaceae bacterium]
MATTRGVTDQPSTPRGLDADRESFVAFLRDHSLPVTAQRLAIAEVVLGTERHLSAEDIAEALRARGNQAGTATVYRTLEVLVRSGLVVERDFGEGFKRYEAARGIPHHEHLLCSVCGRVTEFRDERLERMTTLLAEAHDFSRQRHRLVIYGQCGECRRGDTRSRP